MCWESTIENRNVQETKIKPEIIGRSAIIFDNYPCINQPALKETKDENGPTISQKHSQIFMLNKLPQVIQAIEHTTK
jgi:hypothetical protein